MYVYVALLFTLIDYVFAPPPPVLFCTGRGTVRISQPFFKLVEKYCVLIYDKKIEKLDNKVES